MKKKQSKVVKQNKYNTPYKFMAEGKAACSCCKLEYWKGSVLTGFSIVLVSKDNEDCGSCIDIPASEIENLIKVAREHSSDE